MNELIATEAQVALPPVAELPWDTSPANTVAALREIAALDGLADEEYRWLATHGESRIVAPGTLLFAEGDFAHHLNIILRGEIHVRRRRGGAMRLFIGRAGQLTGKLPFSRMKTYGGDGYSSDTVWGLDIHESLFPAMLAAIPSMAQRCVTVLLDRVREVTRMEQQAEKLAALGKLAANLAHELNNPASAAQRSATSLHTELRSYGERKYALGALCHDNDTCERLRAWTTGVRNQVLSSESVAASLAGQTEGGLLDTADREAAILSWLERHAVPDAWTIAPTLAEQHFPLELLDGFTAQFPAELIGPAMGVFASGLKVERMAQTIVGSTGRIFDLISAIKSYSYMDQAPIQDVDLARQLENTLSMFASRMARVEVERAYDPELPPIAAYGSELNQVWTALIENALDAMPDGGCLRLTTRLEGRNALVEVWDTGVGVPEAQQSRIFEPFFTTKAPGSGLGLGLDTAQRVVARHQGTISVTSTPGKTCFQVRLPLDQAEAY